LKEIGLETEQIPSRSDEKFPDIIAKHGKEQYIVELKIKSDDLEELKEEEAVLRQGEIVHKETPTGPRNRLYAIISDGVKQMVTYDRGHNAFHIIWLHSTGQNAALLNKRFHATLFGTQDLISVQRKYVTTCYYFKESSFFSHRYELDGAILTYENKLQLCVNSLSSIYQSLTQSFLYRNLSKGLCDPTILTGNANVMIADCDFNRKGEIKILKYLEDKYALRHLQAINMKQFSGKTLLSNNGST